LSPEKAIAFPAKGAVESPASQGSAKVHLDERDGGTVIRYTADASIGGKLAQLGGRLIESTSRKLSAQFFERISEIANSK
jgi:uncharacterized protein